MTGQDGDLYGLTNDGETLYKFKFSDRGWGEPIPLYRLPCPSFSAWDYASRTHPRYVRLSLWHDNRPGRNRRWHGFQA
jgi:hypothetical protein